jgi:hypothetical protein
MIRELHTSDLLSGCLRRVQLRHEGKAIGKCTGALYRGLLFHEAARMLHTANMIGEPLAITTEAAQTVAKTLHAERRPPTESVKAKAADTVADVAALIGHYQRRFSDLFAHSKVIGLEVPIRLTMVVDDQPQEFASHLDILYRDPHGNLRVDDWKSGDDDWGSEHVHRSLQLGLYYMAVQYGSVMIGGEWIELGEAPTVAVIEVNNLYPYTRKVTAKDDTGNEREFVKGDDRPLSSIRREVLVTNEAAIHDELALRVRMNRAGFWPTNPTADGCRFCESSSHCPHWSKEHHDENF